MRYVGVLGLALAIGLAGAFPASAGEPLSADTALATASGATFTAPAGWSVTSASSKSILEPPEADSHLALVDVQAADAAAAVAAAWAAYRPDAKRPLRVTPPPAPHNGWGGGGVFSFEKPPQEKAGGLAPARR